jgi:hypothetical protein
MESVDIHWIVTVKPSVMKGGKVSKW